MTPQHDERPPYADAEEALIAARIRLERALAEVDAAREDIPVRARAYYELAAPHLPVVHQAARVGFGASTFHAWVAPLARARRARKEPQPPRKRPQD